MSSLSYFQLRARRNKKLLFPRDNFKTLIKKKEKKKPSNQQCNETLETRGVLISGIKKK